MTLKQDMEIIFHSGYSDYFIREFEFIILIPTVHTKWPKIIFMFTVVNADWKFRFRKAYRVFRDSVQRNKQIGLCDYVEIEPYCLCKRYYCSNELRTIEMELFLKINNKEKKIRHVIILNPVIKKKRKNVWINKHSFLHKTKQSERTWFHFRLDLF